MLRDWAEIRKVTTELLEDLDIHISDRVRVQLKGASHILHSITMRISAFFLYVHPMAQDPQVLVAFQ